MFIDNITQHLYNVHRCTILYMVLKGFILFYNVVQCFNHCSLSINDAHCFTMLTLMYNVVQRCTMLPIILLHSTALLFVNVVNCLSGWFIVLQDCKSIYNVIKACTLLCDDVRFWTMLYNIMNSLYMFCIVFQAYTLLSKVVYCCTRL